MAPEYLRGAAGWVMSFTKTGKPEGWNVAQVSWGLPQVQVI